MDFLNNLINEFKNNKYVLVKKNNESNLTTNCITNIILNEKNKKILLINDNNILNEIINLIKPFLTENNKIIKNNREYILFNNGNSIKFSSVPQICSFTFDMLFWENFTFSLSDMVYLKELFPALVYKHKIMLTINSNEDKILSFNNSFFSEVYNLNK